MRYDTVIIGGGLSSLVAGLRLIHAGQNVAIVSAGQSALHFNSGSFSLMGHMHGKDVVDDPLGVISTLSPDHPYSKVGVERIRAYMPEVTGIFSEAGISLYGSHERNHFRLTPVGMFKPAWLSMEGLATVADPCRIPWGNTLIVNLNGFLDFYPQFLALGLERAGLSVTMRHFTLPAIETLRHNSTEMRATNIARVLVGKAIDEVAHNLNRLIDESDAQTVLMPSVFGLFDEIPLKLLRERVTRPLSLVATIPMSVAGMRAQIRLRRHFQQLGGDYLLGDTVSRGKFDGDRLVSVNTVNLGDMPLEADNFIIATGSFFSHGLEATPHSIVEPVFGLDLEASDNRQDWCREDIYADQPYMSYGVITDEDLCVSRMGHRVTNLRAVGAVLAGHNAMTESSGAGVSIFTAMKAADDIIKR